jgi:hypothetical protein
MRAKRSTLTFTGVLTLVCVIPINCARHGESAAPYRDPSVWVDPTNSCNDSSARFLPKYRASDTVSAPNGKYDLELLSAWLARRVPGGWTFGPMVDSLHGIALLWLREPSQKHQALAVLDTLLPANPLFSRTHPDSVVTRKTRWDYAELYDWMQYLNSSMRDLRGVTITGWSIDAIGGRLVFGIEKREMLPSMAAWLVGKGIPCHLVALRIMGQFRLQ